MHRWIKQYDSAVSSLCKRRFFVRVIFIDMANSSHMKNGNGTLKIELYKHAQTQFINLINKAIDKSKRFRILVENLSMSVIASLQD